MEDSKIIELLIAREDKALTYVAQKYAGLYKNIIKQLLEDKNDVEECENDVLLGLWNTIPPNQPNSLCAYVCKIARNISVNKYKYNIREKRNSSYTTLLDELEECIPDRSVGNNYDQQEKSKEINKILSEFLINLDAQTRIIFVRRYFYLESVTSLSKRFEISENTISVKLFRARKKLYNILNKEGISL